MLFIGIEANAQIFRWGVKGGVNIADIKNFDNLAAVENTENYTGYHAGIFLGAKFAIVSVQADVLYSLQGVTFSETIAPDDFIDLENSYINVPIMAKINFIPLMNIQAGFQYSFLTKSVIDGEADYPIGGGTPINVQDQFKSGDASILIGIGFDISKLVIDLRYNFGVSDNNAGTLTTEQLKNGTFQASLGVRFK